MKILANDPSIRGWGWAIIQLEGSFCRILDSGCIRTSSEHKKRRIRKADDTVRRLNIISDELVEIHKEYEVDWVLSELPHGSQSASASKMIGAVAGISCAFSSCFDIPIEYYSEGDAKKHLSGKRSLTKEETIERVTEIYGDGWHHQYKYQNEAVADALAIFHVGRNSSQALIFASNQ